ncbi:hypothetical protein HUN08_13270 [Gordonia sp. X0973]|uniref:hypothetical protein n=1 Tax=Gordonia sp. X0973 TaxID=2742602 RepID=UPI0013E9BDE1|nr:hypothetical protein [Gordonia sp. X0973]QKT08046.1 hypothetical protein HUN08_13270 [Gordonia sp. X0973]
MTGRQAHKGKKRPRSWHRRFNGPDKAHLVAQRKIDRALRRAAKQLVDPDSLPA